MIGLSHEAMAAIARGKAASLHIEEAGIESRFESMCLARGFTYAVERLEAVKQRVHGRLAALAIGDNGEWVG